MQLSKELTKVTSFSKFLALALFILLPFLTFFLGIEFQKKSMNYFQSASRPIIRRFNPTPTSFWDSYVAKCPLYGKSSKEDFLVSYAVKSGDTLLTIANNELGDVSRVNQIVKLNSDRYPTLSVSTPFLEQGWILYLPPKDLPPTHETIYEMSGEVTEIHEDGRWGFRGPRFSTGFVSDQDTKFINKTSFVVGDCITIVAEGATTKAFSIRSQN